MKDFFFFSLFFCLRRTTILFFSFIFFFFSHFFWKPRMFRNEKKRKSTALVQQCEDTLVNICSQKRLGENEGNGNEKGSKRRGNGGKKDGWRQECGKQTVEEEEVPTDKSRQPLNYRFRPKLILQISGPINDKRLKYTGLPLVHQPRESSRSNGNCDSATLHPYANERMNLQNDERRIADFGCTERQQQPQSRIQM